MDDDQNLTGSTGDSGSEGPEDGIPIKFNLPAPANLQGEIDASVRHHSGINPQAAASTPAPSAPTATSEPPPAPTQAPAQAPVSIIVLSSPPAQAVPAPVAPQLAPAAAPPKPPRKIDPRYIMVGILSTIFIVVSVFFYSAFVSFMRGEEKIVTLPTPQQAEPLFGAATEQKICAETETMDQKGNCVCKTDYVKQSEGKGECTYDCNGVISKIQGLQKDITTSGSAELSAQLASLQADAQKNNCSLPASLRTNCQQLQDDSLNSLAQKDYYNYYLASRKYIEGDCSGKNLNSCDVTLAVADLINRVIVSRPPQDIIDRLRTDRNKLKDNYYQSPTCSAASSIVERCEEIKIKYKLDGSTQETANPTIFDNNTEQVILATANLTDPGSVFLDDREFYLQNCISQQATQETTGSTLQQLTQQATQQGVPRKVPRTKQ